MQERAQISGVGTIYAALAAASSRPRYAFLVLQLVVDGPRNSSGRPAREQVALRASRNEGGKSASGSSRS
jgi:hypothetical protein